MSNCLHRYAFVLACLVAIAAPVAAQQGQAGFSTQTPRPTPGRTHADADSDKSAPQAFSVVLVVGDNQASVIQDNVPAAARKALADMKDFLPYKGYRLLDTQWTLCCGNSPITSRLRGPEEQEYDLQLSASPVGQGRVNVRFFLNEAAGTSEDSAEARARIADIEKQIAALRRQSNSGAGGEKAPDQQQRTAQIAALQREAEELRRAEFKYMPRIAGGRRGAIIDASFRMDVGETVVVGTSRTKGDKALIALLTAVPPKASATR